MQGVFAMLHSKSNRHAAALTKYQAAKELAEQQLNSRAAAAAADAKLRLDAVSSTIEADMAVLADDRVMVLDEQQLQEVGHTTDA